MSEITLDPVEARDRVADLLDDDDALHGVVLVGADTQDAGTVHYAVAVVERKYEGEMYLNERYAMLPEDSTGMSDTFMKNGINRRFVPGMSNALADVYDSIAFRRERMESGESIEARIGVATGTDTVDEVDDGR